MLQNVPKTLNRIMLAITSLLMIVFSLVVAPDAHASAGNNNLKIIAWYGAGNLSKSEYTRDTIILFNPTAAAITMNGWSLQAGSTTGTFSAVTYLLPNVTIPAGGYYAIAGSGTAYKSGSGCTGANCQTNFVYDYQLKTLEGTNTTSDNDLSSTDTTMALVNNQSPVGTCPLTSPNLVDMIGVSAADGSAQVTCYPGGGAAPYTPATTNSVSAAGKLTNAATSIHGVVYAYGTVRRNRCVDTFNNAADFMLGYIDFENSSSKPTPCPTAGSQLSVAAAATPDNVAVSGSFTLTATVTPATSPASTGLNVTADLSNLGLSATTQLYDDGTHGDAVAGDGIYTLTTAPVSGTAGTILGLIVTATDTQGNVASAPVPFSLGGGEIPGPGNNNLEIVAWYGAGNLSKSQYARDTVILFNPTQNPITMNNWSLQTGSTTGTFGTVYKLPVATIPSGGYYAIAGSGTAYISSSGCTSTTCNANFAYDYQLKTIEGTATTSDNDLSSTNVVVALANTQTALGSCPQGSPNLVDLVGVSAFDGSTSVTCYAGTGSANYTPSTINGNATSINGIVYAYATVRSNRCSNTYDNSKDFALDYIDFENSASLPQPCGSGTPLTVSASASPNTRGVSETFVLSAGIKPASNPTSTGLTVTADLSNLGLSTAEALYDDGTHGDVTPGDHLYTLSTAAASGTIGAVPGLNVTATDAQGNKAQTSFQLTLQPGTITMTTPTLTATVNAGDVATFPITVTGQHGYFGILNIVCTGSPNTNSLGVPVATQCLPSPPELTISTPNGTGTFSLAIATGLTKSAGTASSWPLAAIAAFTAAIVAFSFRRRKYLAATLALALVSFLTLSTTGCGKNGGLLNVTAAPGTYTYTIVATDVTTPTITGTLTFTVTVK